VLGGGENCFGDGVQQLGAFAFASPLMRAFAIAYRYDVAVGPDSFTGLPTKAGLSRVVSPVYKQRAVDRNDYFSDWPQHSGAFAVAMP